MAVNKNPFSNALRFFAHKTEFAHGRPLHGFGFSGLYDTFEEAQRSIPSSKKAGYDHAEMAELDQTSPGNLNYQDYSVLFWLQRILPEIGTLVDFGGHFGELYYAYRNYLKFREDFVWRICDVPAIIEGGKKLAERLGAPNLQFSINAEDAEGADAFLAAGSLQYLPDGFLASTLGRLRKKPRHVFVHRTPLHEEKTFITVQATAVKTSGPVFCPYTIAHRRKLIDAMAAIGYAVVDSWKTKRSLEVPFCPDCRLDFYSGIYFRLEK
jgi:putative methyltransferase (TIGR04325 family)